VIPFLWALVGTTAALPPFNIREDFGLLTSALLSSALLLFSRKKDARQAAVLSAAHAPGWRRPCARAGNGKPHCDQIERAGRRQGQ